jgi:hypothetical protein
LLGVVKMRATRRPGRRLVMTALLPCLAVLGCAPAPDDALAPERPPAPVLAQPLPLVSTSSAEGQGQTCTSVNGKIFEKVSPDDGAPEDPFGRVVGTVTGSLAGTETAVLTSSPRQNPVGTINAFATDRGLLIATGRAVFSPLRPIPDGPTVVGDALELTVTHGTGEFTGATGTIRATGFGFDVSPGEGEFVLDYTGRICTPAS